MGAESPTRILGYLCVHDLRGLCATAAATCAAPGMLLAAHLPRVRFLLTTHMRFLQGRRQGELTSGGRPACLVVRCVPRQPQTLSPDLEIHAYTSVNLDLKRDHLPDFLGVRPTRILETLLGCQQHSLLQIE